MFKGNSYKWFTTTSLVDTLDSDIKVQGTVKDHDIYQGAKSTIITRCKII